MHASTSLNQCLYKGVGGAIYEAFLQLSTEQMVINQLIFLLFMRLVDRSDEYQGHQETP